MATLRAITSFRAAAKPGQVRGPFVKAGQLVDDTDPVVAGREALFVPADSAATRPSEPVTSSRPKKAAPKKAAAK